MSNTITIYEHEALYVHKGDQRLSEYELKSLQLFFREEKFPYYNLVHNGIKFCEHVGVIRVGKLTIEVLPKADRNHNKAHWRGLLIDMLRNSGIFDIQAPSSAQLSIKSNSILEHYFALFISELEQIVHSGLIKRYRKIAKNTNALKGKLLFGKHISYNSVHQERFYVQHTVYDQHHLLNQILFKTLRLLRHNNLNQSLSSRINNLCLNFPEMRNIEVNDEVFERIVYDRKNQGYKKAVEISRLLLLNYHPDISSGRENVLALMFDMNLLWERFVLKALQKYKPVDLIIKGQTSKKFWKADFGRTRVMKPDIVIESVGKYVYLLDTKWKNIINSSASDDDLRQMYAYSKFHDNANVCLLYPGSETKFIAGNFMNERNHEKPSENKCGIMKIVLLSGDSKGQEKLAKQLLNLLMVV